MQMSDVVIALMRERARQDEKWGEQNHRDGTGGEHYWEVARIMREDCDRAAREERVTWAHILEEEVYEALAEKDSAALRTELIQVAAVAVAWVQAIDRRRP